MGIITKAVFFSSFYLSSALAFSSTFINENPQEGDLYYYSNGKPAPEVVTPMIPDCIGFGKKTVAECKGIMASETASYISSYGDGITVRMKARGELTYTQTSNGLTSLQLTTIQRKYTNPDRWADFSNSSKSQFASIIEEMVPQCPDPSWPNYLVRAYLGQALFCFEQTDLNFRDSCPDSVSDGAYILPSTTLNSSPNICLDKPDGSSCKYDLVGDAYITNFENDCYQNNGAPRWQDGEATQPDETNLDCQDIGGNAEFCIEQKDNVCDSQGNCNTGCGTIAIGNSTPVFGCFAGDLDGDGVPDYKDPDVDGDGIRNEDDLDNDGDGVDDPIYPNSGGGGGGVVNIDLTTLENLTGETNSALADTNTTLDEIKAELVKQNGSGQMPAYTTIQNNDIAEASALSRIKDSPVSLALIGMTNFINFGSGASCPVLSVYLSSPIDTTVGTSIHCDIMPTFTLIITPVMLAFYLWLAFRIFASA